MRHFVSLLMMFLLLGCAGGKNAVFVTSSSLSVLEGDANPGGVSIGYKRVEGYIGPNNADGSAPPVVAIIESDGEVINPKIRQLYATGAAALAATKDKDTQSQSKSVEVKNDTDTMMFGTSTTIGLSVGTSESLPTSFSFGYKRKEMSIIPLVEKADKSGYDYPAVFASIDSTASGEDKELKVYQTFASGQSAVDLAKRYSDTFLRRFGDSIGDLQQQEAANVLVCYPGVSLKHRPDVWQHANQKKLFFETPEEEGQTLAILTKGYNEAVVQGKLIDADKLFRADSAYSGTIKITDVRDSERLERLIEHAQFVCGLSTINVRS